MAFSTTHKLNQTLALLQQLPGNTDLIPLVLAPVDAGKSSLWQQLCSKAPNHWRLAALSAQPKLTRHQLMRRLVSDWLPGKTEISHSQLLLELKQLQSQGLLPVLALDNADQLPLELLQLLRQLPVSLVFFAEQPPGGAEAIYQVLPLAPWNRDEIAAFVRHQSGQTPSDWALDRLMVSSQGLPGRLTALLEGASARLSDSSPTQVQASPSGQPGFRARITTRLLANLNLWLGLAAIILLLVLGYAFNKERINQGLQHLSNRLADHKETKLTPGLLLPEPAAETQPEAQPQAPQPAPPEQSLTPPSAPAPEPLPPAEAPVAALPAAEPAAPDPTTATDVTASISPAAEEPRPPATRATDGILHGPEWLLQQPSSQHGIEIVELASLDALEAYAKKHRLSGSVPLSWLVAKGKNKNAVLLILGNYPSQQAAAKARLMLPDSINIDKVRVRSFDELQKQIKR
jgi:hypothetical protein